MNYERLHGEAIGELSYRSQQSVPVPNGYVCIYVCVAVLHSPVPKSFLSEYSHVDDPRYLKGLFPLILDYT